MHQMEHQSKFSSISNVLSNIIMLFKGAPLVAAEQLNGALWCYITIKIIMQPWIFNPFVMKQEEHWPQSAYQGQRHFLLGPSCCAPFGHKWDHVCRGPVNVA